MYYTAVNYKSNKIGKKIWESADKNVQVYEFQGRYELIKNDYSIARLIDGKEGLEKYYKGVLGFWLDKIKEKDLKKAKKIREQAQKAIEDADFIELMWGIPNRR